MQQLNELKEKEIIKAFESGAGRCIFIRVNNECVENKC